MAKYNNDKMSIAQFWLRASDILALYHGRYRKALLTEDEQLEDISSFLSDMDSLASSWYNREGDQ